MVLEKLRTPLVLKTLADALPGPCEIRLRVEACAVCRTDLHVVDGELESPKLPLVPGHEIVGVVETVGEGADPSLLGSRVGVPWLGFTCGHCFYCRAGLENLCDKPLFTGFTRDGGFATHVVADQRFCFKLESTDDPVAVAPLLCAGLVGWRALKKTACAKRIGLFGFGAAAHIITQISIWQGREIYAFTRTGDVQAQRFASSLGASWAGDSNEMPKALLDAAIIFAPVGELVPTALRAVRKGGRVVCGGIHMSDIPQMPYSILWGEREVVSIANLTRADAREFFPIARNAKVKTHTVIYPLERANEALDDLRHGRLNGDRELAMGAVVNAQKPIVVREEDVIALAHVSEAEFEAACEREIAEIERRGDVYFGARAPLDIANRIVIVVDDGIATGSTIRAAVAGIKERQPTKIVVAIPVASPKAVAALRGEVDEVCCLLLPSQMDAIGCFYEDFPQLDDDDVVRVLAAADASNERG